MAISSIWKCGKQLSLKNDQIWHTTDTLKTHKKCYRCLPSKDIFNSEICFEDDKLVIGTCESEEWSSQ